jgi:16S rRNA (cytosine967-C5)-methyltransferase
MGEAIENHAAEVLGLIRPGERADAALRGYLARHGRLGAAGRRSVSRAVFAYFRWLQWLDPRESAQKRIGAALGLQVRFERDPSSVKVEALAARAAPAWLATEMDLSADFLRQLQREPPLWIRAKIGQVGAVERDLGNSEAPTFSGALLPPPRLTALRYRGPMDLHRTPEFQSGKFEIQDVSSQLVGHACAPEAGDTWWDACAGEGGKALHLSDLMGNKGLLLATDRSARRLALLKLRAARAGMFNYRSFVWTGTGPALRTPCDGVLVDAPCSGVGTWRRNPQARWTTSVEDVRELAAVQEALLDRVAAAVKPGGRLIYSVCTLTRSETASVADRFEKSHPEFEPAPLGLTAPAFARVTLLPPEVDGNGMFIAGWKRLR